MSRKIRLKRGNLADLPQLELGEPGVATDDGSLYIGTDRGNVRLANQDDLDGVNQQLADKADKSLAESAHLRVDELVIGSGDANAEVTDARVSAIKNKSFTTLRNRFEEIEKDSFLPIINEIVNGNFSTDSNGDGLADNWTASGSNVTIPRVEGNVQYWTPATLTYSGSIAYGSPKRVSLVSENKYYLAIKQKNVKQIYMNLADRIILNSISTDGRVSIVFTANQTIDTNVSFYGRVAGTESSVSDFIMVDLSKTFGKGKEPSLEEFEELAGTEWFGGTRNLINNKGMFNLLLEVSRNSQGGTDVPAEVSLLINALTQENEPWEVV